MTKGKNKKIKIRKIYLFLLPPLPFQDGEGGGGGGLFQSSLSSTFFTAKLKKKNFIDTWVSGQKVDELTEWQS